MTDTSVSRRQRWRRWYYRHVDFGDPQRWVHMVYRECSRPDCWCHEDRAGQRTPEVEASTNEFLRLTFGRRLPRA